VYCSGQTQGFNYTGYFGTAIAPNGAFTINGSKQLEFGSGTYYFYLVYDVSTSANLGDGLDASMISFVFNGGPITNMTTPNPTGIRTISSGTCPPAPDMPNPPANMQTIPINSLIIPMDNAHQNLYGGYPFNIKAYGLVHSLLMNDIPVRWVIRSGKALDGIDFTANVTREYPTFLPAANESFAGGAFIIDSTWVNRPFYSGGQTATQVITAFAPWRVAVYKLTANISVDVRYTLNQRPKIAIFNNGGNNLLQSEILDSAKITNYVAINTGLFTGLAECYTFCSEAHWGGTVADTNITRSVRDFVNSGGNFLAECLGIDTYENNQGPYHFHTTNGITITNNNITNAYHNPDLAYMQINGSVIANPGGSEVNWVLNGGNFVPGFYRAISSSTNPDNIFTAGAHLASPDSIGSNVFYLGGHDFSANWGTLTYINAQRLYLNAATIPAHRPTAFMLNPGPDTTVCQGQSVTLGGSPTGPSGATYNWSPSTGLSSTTASNPVATPSVTTTYTVVANDNGCPGGPAYVTITVVPVPAAPTAGSNSPLCSGSTLNLSASTISGATYNWTGPNGFTSNLQNPSIPNVTVAASGTYSVTATVSGCTGPVGTVVVTITASPAAPSAGSNSPVCEGQTLNLTASTIPGATYNWTGPNGFTSTTQNPSLPNVQLVNAGTYSVTATVSGCTGPAGTVTVVVNPVPAAPTAGSNSPLCVGATLNLTASTVPSATYNWTGPNGFTSTLQNPSIVNAQLVNAGTYSVTVTVSGCTSPAGTTAVTISAVPSAPTAGSNSPVCVGATLNLTSSTIPSATYNWSGPNGFTSTLQNPSITNVQLVNAGTYSVTATVNGCTSPSGTVTVTVNPVPAAPTPSSNSPVCQGTTLNLSTSFVSGATYNWTGPNSFTSSLQNPSITNVQPVNAGTYTLTITVSGCTSPQGTTTVVVNSTPAAPVAGGNTPLCVGATLNLTASTIPGATYNWTGPNGFTSSLQNPSITNVQLVNAGTYSVTATVNGCTGPAGTRTIVVNPIPATPTPSSNSPVCQGATLNLSTAFVSGATYNWTGPNSFTSTLQNPNITNVQPVNAGTYSLTITVAGCTSPVGTTTVVVNTTPAAPTAGSNSPVCTGATLNLTASTIPGATYNWTGPNGFTSTQQNPSITNVQLVNAGTYSVTATVSGCTGPAGTVTVVVNPTPAQPTGGSNSPLCVNMTLNLTCVTVSGATYNWTGPNSFTSTSQNPSISNVTTADAGNYLVTVTVNGCTSPADTVVVIINSAPATPVAGSNSPVCTGQTLNLTSTFIPGTYAWTGPNGFTSSLQNPSIPNVQLVNAGTYTVTVNNGCASSPATTTVVVNQTPAAPTLGSNSPVCVGSTLNLTSNSVPGATYAWTGPNGFTSALQNPSIPNVQLVNAGTYSLTITSSSGCVSPQSTITVSVVASAIVNAGADQTVCANNAVVTLSGSSTTGSGTWSTSGSGTFSPNNTTLNATYTPSAADTAAGTVTLTLTSTNNGPCAAVTDQMVITITPAPTANAGPDQTVCANNATVTLNGSVTVATGGVWSTSGTGSFTPNNTTLNATYVPSAADTAAGSVTLLLTTTGNGTCLAVSDSMVITITDAPVVNAGLDDSACVNNPNITLNGSSSTGTGTWSTSGTGTFNPNNTTFNATYVPSAGDLAGGFVTLVLTSTNNGTCLPVTDTVILTYTSTPVVSAGPDVTVCANNGNVTLSGSSSTGSGSWSTSGSGTFSPSNNVLNATYIPSNADTAAGTVTLTLTSTNNGGCVPVTDQLVITITDAPIANAGPDQSVCANNAVVTLNGSFVVATGAQWSTSGTGIFTPDNLSMNATYTPSSADTLAGSVTIVLTTTGNGNCNAVTDTMLIIYTNAPVVNAGPDIIACKSSPNVPLTGTSTTGSGTWTSSGTGSFSPNPNVLNPTYIPSTADTTAGTVTIIFTSTANGGCNAVTDTIVVSWQNTPVVNAGSNQTVCANNANVTLNGVSSTGTGIWSTSGSGTFSPSNTTLNATYIPSAADTAAGTVTLTLTATNGCFPTQQSIVITITDAPVVDAGANIAVCRNNPNATLSGSVTGGATTGVWSTSGSGTFNPSNTDMNATYVPSTADTTAGMVTIVLTSTNNGNCLAVTDTITITYTPPPTALAGSDLTGCANNALQLSGTILGGNGTGVWTTPNGTGTFFPNNTALNGSYIPSNADTANSPIILILTSTNNGGCLPSSDTLLINVNPGPVVDAGADQTVCANNATVTLSGSVVNATGGEWSSSGSGSWVPDSLTLNTTYIPSAGDTAAGSVTIYLTSTGNGFCNAVTDSMVITITDAPVVSAGSNIFICTGTMTAQLNGSVSGGATTGTWTTLGSGTFSPNNNTLNAVYNLSTADTAAGTVTLVLTSTNNGNCLAVSDTVTITITSIPVTNAGADTTACANNAAITLNGSVIGGGGSGQWTSSGTGTFTPNDTTLNATYTPSAADISSGSVTLILTATNSCMPVTDTIVIVYTPAPTVDAGANQTICAGDVVQLNGSVTIATGGQWTSSGDGTFTPNDSTLNATYIPGTNDIASGSVTLYLTTTGNGTCLAVPDSMVITIQAKPVAGFTYSPACLNAAIAFTDASTGAVNTWSWNFGNGTSTSQNPSNTYTTTGLQTVTLIVATSAGCSDTVSRTVFVNPLPTANYSHTTHCPDSAMFTDLSSGAVSWGWDFGDSTSSALQNPNHTYDSSGTYVVTLTATSDSGCVHSLSDTVVITPCDDDIVNDPTVPSAFTPNDDGYNDDLVVLGGPFKELVFRVYNEWGNEIFTGTVQSEGWDGTYKGKPQPGGVYVWTIHVVTMDDRQIDLAGDVTLIR
jgi:gliding motility-associated-like protein